MAVRKPGTTRAKKEFSLKSELEAHFRPKYGTNIARDRVINPAIPNDPLYVHDMPSEYDYKWLPAPTSVDQAHAAPTLDMAMAMSTIRQQYMNSGRWRYYPPELFGKNPNQGKPWILDEWIKEGNKVRAQGHWLIAVNKDVERDAYQGNISRWNDAREPHDQELPEGGKLLEENRVDGQLKHGELLEETRQKLQGVGSDDFSKLQEAAAAVVDDEG